MPIVSILLYQQTLWALLSGLSSAPSEPRREEVWKDVTGRWKHGEDGKQDIWEEPLQGPKYMPGQIHPIFVYCRVFWYILMKLMVSHVIRMKLMDHLKDYFHSTSNSSPPKSALKRPTEAKFSCRVDGLRRGSAKQSSSWGDWSNLWWYINWVAIWYN